MNIPAILILTRERHDFQGLQLFTNYADYPPLCIVDEQANGHKIFSGWFPDTLHIISEYLNLTLELQEPMEENRNIWHKTLSSFKQRFFG